MENKSKTYFYIFLMAVIALLFGYILYNTYNRNTLDTNIVNMQKLAEIDNTNNSNENQIVETSITNDGISPNAIVIEKRYYKKCDHLIKETVDIPEELINKKKSDVEEYYKEWKIEKYSTTEIIVYKEFNGLCDEHYVVRDNNGVIGIFIENEYGIEELQENTEIETQYLPEEDVEKFKTGVHVVGKMNLNIFLEDYE